MTTALKAKLENGRYEIYAATMTVPFGSVDAEGREFVTDDKRLLGYVDFAWGDVNNLPTALAAIRAGYDAYSADIDAESNADMATELAVERYYEGAGRMDQCWYENQLDMARYDAEMDALNYG